MNTLIRIATKTNPTTRINLKIKENDHYHIPVIGGRRFKSKNITALDGKMKKLYHLKVIEKTKKIKFQSRLPGPKERLSRREANHRPHQIEQMHKIGKIQNVNNESSSALLLPKGCWTVALDLKDGYWHVPVTSRKRLFLGFHYRGQNWQFRALPFGLNIWPRVFTKLMAHVIKTLAAKGIWCLPYLDYLLIINNSKEECLRLTNCHLDNSPSGGS